MFIIYDGGQKKHVYLPSLGTFTELYVGSDGSTYYDSGLTQTAQEALPPTPTSTPTPEDYLAPSPTPVCYHTLPPSPTTAPTCSCCPSTDPRYVFLSDQTSSAGIIYDSTYACRPDPENLLDWWTSCADWLEVTPPRGFGIDGQIYSVSIALGDTSSLSPGWHRSEIVYFHDLCNFANVHVDYYKATPPTPSPTGTPSPAPTPPPTPDPTVTPICLPCAPWIEPHQISLTDQAAWATATYFCVWCCNNTCCCAWTVSICPDWLTVDPSSGSGLDPESYGLTISLGDISALPYGLTNALIWFQCTTCSEWSDYLIVNYRKYPPRLPMDTGDYDGDGTSDIAVWRGTSGLWAVQNFTRAYFGSPTDCPVPADYDGDGTADIAVFRESSGLWAVKDVSRFHLGINGDTPVPGDYDDDGVSEAGIFRGSNALWAIRGVTRLHFGWSGDTPIPGRYDTGSAKKIAVFQRNLGLWSVRNLTEFYFGVSDDELVPGDYNGAGRWEAGIFRPSTGMWSIRNVTRMYLGSTNDWALPADYNGDGMDDLGIFRNSAGMWSVRNLTRVYFGGTGDIPVTR